MFASVGTLHVTSLQTRHYRLVAFDCTERMRRFADADFPTWRVRSREWGVGSGESGKAEGAGEAGGAGEKAIKDTKYKNLAFSLYPSSLSSRMAVKLHDISDRHA